LRTFLARGFRDRTLAFDGRSLRRDRHGPTACRPVDAVDGLIAAIARSRAATVAPGKAADFGGCGVSVIDPRRQ
jgi:predicted nucleic acid-binding protein